MPSKLPAAARLARSEPRASCCGREVPRRGARPPGGSDAGGTGRGTSGVWGSCWCIAVLADWTVPTRADASHEWGALMSLTLLSGGRYPSFAASTFDLAFLMRTK